MTVSETAPIPTVGRIVQYVLNPTDADQINAKRNARASAMRAAIPPAKDGRQEHVGNDAHAGDVCAAVIVRVWGGNPNSAVNLQVLLDGVDSYWATSRSASEELEQGSFVWPVRARP